MAWLPCVARLTGEGVPAPAGGVRQTPTREGAEGPSLQWPKATVPAEESVSSAFRGGERSSWSRQARRSRGQDPASVAAFGPRATFGCRPPSATLTKPRRQAGGDVLEARTVSISIERPWRDLYEAVWRPECFPGWASGLSGSSLEKDGEAWKAEGPEGPIRIRFTGHNAFGVMDHHVDAGSGPEIHVPMRVVQNADGAEVLLTLFRQPGMSDAKFLADIEWVRRDLSALRAMATS